MPPTLTVNISTPIQSVSMVDDLPEIGDFSSEMPESEAMPVDASFDHSGYFANTNAALEHAVSEFQVLRNEVFSSHAEQIAKLSVQIARKILQKDIEDKKYDIENILEKVLRTVPNQQDIVIHLNPDDLTKYNETIDDNKPNFLSHTKMISDPSVGCAECIVETDKGMIEYVIEDHLVQIENALKNEE
jgi:flagellar biosynthesis/type III secretory pathway protein FliH